MRVVIVDFSLALVHLGDCLVVLLHGLVVIRGCNTELLAQIDKALEEMIADGTMQAIIDKYIK